MVTNTKHGGRQLNADDHTSLDYLMYPWKPADTENLPARRPAKKKQLKRHAGLVEQAKRVADTGALFAEFCGPASGYASAVTPANSRAGKALLRRRNA